MPSRVKLLICSSRPALANDESPGVEKILSDIDTDKDGKVSSMSWLRASESGVDCQRVWNEE